MLTEIFFGKTHFFTVDPPLSPLPLRALRPQELGFLKLSSTENDLNFNNYCNNIVQLKSKLRGGRVLVHCIIWDIA